MEQYSLDEENRKKHSRRKVLWSNIVNIMDTVREHEPVTINNLNKEYRDDIFAILSNADLKIQQIFLKYSDEIVFINENAIGRGVTKQTGIRLNWKNDKVNKRGEYTTTFHEIGHSIDRAAGGLSYKTLDFKEALKKDFDNLVKAYTESYNVSMQVAYAEIGEALQEEKYHAVSDIISGITRNKCHGKYVHTNEYWNRKYKLEKETFAHFYEAYARNDIDKIKILSETFPNAVKEFMKLLEV